jgi:hypothetical protein
MARRHEVADFRCRPELSGLTWIAQVTRQGSVVKVIRLGSWEQAVQWLLVERAPYEADGWNLVS